jgi:hypothetical protein
MSGNNEEGMKIINDATIKLKVLTGFDENGCWTSNFRITADDKSDMLFCEGSCKKVYINGVDFDSILSRLADLERKGLWNWIKTFWRK